MDRHFLGFGNYVRAITNPFFLISVRITLIYTFIVVSVESVLGFCLALLLNRDRKGAGFFRTLFLIPVLLTPCIVGMVWRILYNPDFGMVNYLVSLIGVGAKSWLGEVSTALPAVIFVDVWQWTPFMMLILLAGLKSLPKSPFEAAMIDGASRIQMLRSITIPLLRPVISVAVLIRMMDTLRIFDTIYILTGGGPGNSTEVLSLFVYRAGLKHLQMGYASALSYLMLIMTIILTIQLLRFVVGTKRTR